MPGTHDWNKFVSPRELSADIENEGLTVLETQGVGFDPLAWRWRLSSDTDVNYNAGGGKTGEARAVAGVCTRHLYFSFLREARRS